ncbi:hypothetical protein LY76DRAFT_584801 [Colletotrichum caudatum]|nr:hypothetical protein LY76DRAFT_584801 [Colletotrichum caudatum]
MTPKNHGSESEPTPAESDPKARRREQNRIAQRNSRRRRAIYKAKGSQSAAGAEQNDKRCSPNWPHHGTVEGLHLPESANNTQHQTEAANFAQELQDTQAMSSSTRGSENCLGLCLSPSSKDYLLESQDLPDFTIPDLIDEPGAHSTGSDPTLLSLGSPVGILSGECMRGCICDNEKVCIVALVRPRHWSNLLCNWTLTDT